MTADREDRAQRSRGNRSSRPRPLKGVPHGGHHRGLGVIFITHNPHHAFPVGDRFVILNRGKLMGDWRRGEITRDEIVTKMSGGAELDQLTHELERQLEAT